MVEHRLNLLLAKKKWKQYNAVPIEGLKNKFRDKEIQTLFLENPLEYTKAACWSCAFKKFQTEI